MKNMKKRGQTVLSLMIALVMTITTMIGTYGTAVHAEETGNDIYVRYNGVDTAYIDVDDDVTEADIQYDSALFRHELIETDGKKQVAIRGTCVPNETYTAYALGIEDLKIKDTSYKVHVHFYFRIQAVLSEDESVIIDENVQDGRLTNWGDFAANPKAIDGYVLDRSYNNGDGYKLDWDAVDEKGDYYLVTFAYIKQDGTYTLEDKGDSNIPFVLVDAMAEGGEVIGNIKYDDGRVYLAPAGKMYIDGNRVWCVEPLNNTANGSKYEREELDKESVEAAIATRMIEESNDLSTATITALVWKYYTGILNIDPLNTLKTYNESVVGNLSLGQQAQVKYIEDEVNTRSIAYGSLPEGWDLTDMAETDTAGAELKDGTLVLNQNQFPSEIVLKIETEHGIPWVKLFETGSIKYSDGITVETNADDNTITLKIDKDKINDDSQIEVSVIPDSIVGPSYKYVSNYGNQAVAEFRVKDNKAIPLKIVLENGPSEKIEISGTKSWEDNDDQDGKRPASITVNLLADGEKIDSATVNERDDWSYIFEDLDKYKDGKEVVYTISEEKVDGYTASYDGYDITNTYNPEQTSVTVKKVWNDEDNKDKIRPSSVEVQLYANGKAVGTAVTLSENNKWQYTWEDLAKKSNGTDITYSVAETSNVNGYSKNVGVVKDGVVTITNTHTPKKPDVPKNEQPKKPVVPNTGVKE